jgi:peptidoglycan-N-acetylglucosamine deacetylase
MYRYFIKTPWLVKKIFSSYIWNFSASEKSVYLTFDDGPHPTITPWVLNELKKFNALATFFCIGKNVDQHKELYQQILKENHAVGNHTFHHMNGWKTSADKYIADVAEAAKVIHSGLFRPPYGKITSGQAKQIPDALKYDKPKIIMWDVLSGDFDKSLSWQQCLNNVTMNVSNGSIIVFHDSEKAFANLRYVLPESLNYLQKSGYVFKKIE